MLLISSVIQHMSQTTGTELTPECPPIASAEVCYLVDDDPSVRRSISRLLEWEGFNARAFREPEAFLNHMATNPVRLVVLDIWMKRMTGMELLAHLCARLPATPVIFITGHEDRCRSHRDAGPYLWFFYQAFRRRKIHRCRSRRAESGLGGTGATALVRRLGFNRSLSPRWPGLCGRRKERAARLRDV